MRSTTIALAVLFSGQAAAEPVSTTTIAASTTWDSVAESVTQCIASATTCRFELEKHKSMPVDQKSFARHESDCHSLHGLWHPLYPSGEALRIAVEAEDVETNDSEKRVYLLRHAVPESGSVQEAHKWSDHTNVPIGDLIPCGKQYVLAHMFATPQEALQVAESGLFDFVGVLPRALKFSQPADQMFEYRNMTDTTHPNHHPQKELADEEGIDMYIRLVHGCTTHMDHTHAIAGRFERQLSQSHLGAHHVHDIEVVGQHSLVWRATRTSHHGRMTLDAVHDILAQKPEARWIEPKIKLHLHNAESKSLVQSGLGSNGDSSITMPFTTVNDLKGRGYIVGVADSGLDPDSCFFKDNSKSLAAFATGTRTDFGPNEHRKISQYVAFVDGLVGDKGDHGTHVAGTVLGKSNGGNSKSNGIVPEAKVAVFDIGQPGSQAVYPPNNLATDLFPPAYSVGVKIHTNSWGGSVNSYTSMTRDMDEFTHLYQDFLVVVANGNLGKSPDGQIQGKVAAPATAKNVLSVGASQNTDASFSTIGQACPSKVANLNCEENIAVFSADGPTFDGRIKPDVVAPGQYVGSAASLESCGVTYLQGTSMSAPVVAGAAVIAREYFERGFYPNGYEIGSNAFSPMGALLKAVLINGAVPAKGTYNGAAVSAWPGKEQGFGHVVLRGVLKVGDVNDDPTQKVFVNGNIVNRPSLTGQSPPDEYKFNFAPNAEGILKVTMCFFDPPGTLGSRVPTYNDIDLEVQLPDGTIVYPNGLNAADPINTVEQIVITKENQAAFFAAGGEVIVRVKVLRVLNEKQDYAIVVSGPFIEGTVNAGNLAPNIDIYQGLDLSVIAKPARDKGATTTIVGIIVGATLVVMGVGVYLKKNGAANGLVGTLTPSNMKPKGQLSQSAQQQGWSMQTDPSSGKPYYHNRNTGQVTWDMPN